MLVNKIEHKDGVIPRIPIPTSDGFELIPVEHILFCEAKENYTYFNLKNKQKILASRMLKDVEEQLINFPFFLRVHNSFIINVKEVRKYVRGEGGYVIMNDDTPVSVSRSRKDEFLKLFKTSKT
jgi:two-component system LytT family response regulator